MASNRRGVMVGAACAWVFTGVLAAQESCVPAPLFSGNVALGMPFRPAQPGLQQAWSTTHGDFDNDGAIDLIHGTQYGSLVYFRCCGPWWDFDPPVIIDLAWAPPPPGGNWLIKTLLAADFNADGNLDLAVGDYQPTVLFPQTQRIHVMLGNGDGTFQSGTPWGPSTAGVIKFCAADFNGDGHLDVGFGTEGDSTPDIVGIAWGTGAGSFPTWTQVYMSPTGNLPGGGWIETADIDNDLDADAVVDCPGLPVAMVPPAILRNVGNGTFQTEPLPNLGFGHTFGELNGDNLPDLVFATTGNCGSIPNTPGMVHVRLNAAGQFLPGVSYAVTTEPCRTDVGSNPLASDLDGDGRAEVIIGRQSFTPLLSCSATWFEDQVLIFRNTGNGSLIEPPVLRHIVGHNSSVRLSAGDLSGDGRPELIGANLQDTTLLLNDGDGGFLTNYGVPMGPTGSCDQAATTFRLITPGDVNGDGRFDLVAVRQNSGVPISYLECTTMLRDAQGGFTDVFSHPIPEHAPTGLALADFDRDGHMDLALTIDSQSIPNGGNIVRTARGHGDGTFDPWVSHLTVGKSPCHVTAGDLNGDQWPDMVVCTRYDGATPPEEPGGISVFLNNGAGGFLAPVHYEVSNPKWTDIADLNGDGHADLGVTWGIDWGGPAGVQVFLNSGGTGAYAPGPTFEHMYPSRVRFRDVNADGRPDLLFTLWYFWFEPASGGLVVALNNGSGVFQQSAHLGVHLDYTNQGPGAADFDADGHVDMAIAAGTWGIIDLYRGNGDGTFEEAISYGAGRSVVAGGESVIVHDFNEDGRPDLGSALGGSPSRDTNTHVGFSILLNRTCPLCYADCNGDSQLTVADFGCFQTKFVAGDPYADCNGAGGLTVADFGCFQTKFVKGCP